MTPALFAGMLLLAVVALALLLWPLVRNKQNGAVATDATRSDLNAAVYRDQLKELERDRAAGSLSDPGYAQSAEELQRRALADTADMPVTSPTPASGSKRLAAGLTLVVLAAAASMYAWLGNPAATQEQTDRPAITSAQIEGMVAGLAARLQEHPDDPKGWAMLARSYKALGRLELSEQAFTHIGDTLDQDPDLLADYAEVLARLANGNFEGKPQAALNKALELDPGNLQALTIAGIAAYQRHAYNEAADDWERLLAALPPGSEQSKSVADSIAKARSLATNTPGTPATANKSQIAKSDKSKTVRNPPASAVSGRVSLAPALAAQVKAGDTLFVFARTVGGPRMPLAVLRTTASALPLSFTLDDAMAMSPQFKLSALASGTEVQVEARISKSGEALPKAGDLTGSAQPVKPGTGGLKIVIDRTLP